MAHSRARSRRGRGLPRLPWIWGLALREPHPDRPRGRWPGGRRELVVPGRHEINDSQELNYPAIVRAIHETGFQGYIAQEFVPSYDDKIKALEEGMRICEV